MARKDSGAVRITTASRSRSDDIRRRQRRYLLSMAVRTACFLLAIAFRGGPVMWVFVVASFVLPYVAVVMANAGGGTDSGGPEPVPSQALGRSIGPPVQASQTVPRAPAPGFPGAGAQP